MAIPESQLETWSHQGAVTSARATHESIRNALSQYDGWSAGIDYEVYLQGSYKNDTNIRGDSDVDVVVQLNSAFHSNLTEEQKKQFGFTTASYGWQEFREDVQKALCNYFGRDKVQIGKKSLKVKTSYLPADAVVCVQYRRYSTLSHQDYIEGMTFYVPSEDRWVFNYPKLHYDNGTKKNAQNATNGWYKPTVRVFKNVRTYLVDRNVISGDLAPSYFLECLLYNVSNGEFGKNYQEAFCNVVNWLAKANLSQFVCQNEQLILFGNSPEQWSTSKAQQFIGELIKLWNNWR